MDASSEGEGPRGSGLSSHRPDSLLGEVCCGCCCANPAGDVALLCAGVVKSVALKKCPRLCASIASLLEATDTFPLRNKSTFWLSSSCTNSTNTPCGNS